MKRVVHDLRAYPSLFVGHPALKPFHFFMEDVAVRRQQSTATAAIAIIICAAAQKESGGTTTTAEDEQPAIAHKHTDDDEQPATKSPQTGQPDDSYSVRRQMHLQMFWDGESDFDCFGGRLF